ncbi:hypothetical protein RL72_01140 [Microbacterium azadirachtae]|uniref:Uncharacterized protein n=1 Tax=Microbacterium azadirachtae TaxID=582680 RepID=A0A0F0L1H4_9MICO|nr:hypothetical protein [Microbacterium azadirachtae]KJL26205.1 hypothetical protein RL72_01140 [Microbacterium azadirachtae]
MTEQGVTPTPVFDGSDAIFTVSNAKGEDEGDEFIRSLQARDQAKFQRYLEWLRDGHHIKSPENMRHIAAKDPMDRGAEVHELKTHNQGGLRLYLVRFQGRWYITHGDRKGSDRQVVKNAKKAFAIFWDGDIEGEADGAVPNR